MIDYNPKDWFTFIFRLHKADTLRELFPLMIWIALYATGVAWLEKEFFQISADSPLKNLPVLHSILGLVISLLLVFRTNTAYERWWEGRKMWGSLVNASRNLAIKINSFELEKDKKTEFKNLIIDYCFALKNHLRNHSGEDILHKYTAFSVNHVPNFIASKTQNALIELQRKNLISDEKLLLVNNDLTAFTDICGACERIKNTPIPFSYSVFLKKFIFFYVMTMPFGFVFNLSYWMIPVVVFVFYVLASMELIAEEIEDPFGSDANDLPVDRICDGIRGSMEEIIR